MADNTNMLVGGRLQAIIDYYSITAPEFSRALGYERADKIYNILKGKFYPSFEILESITKNFVDVNIDWLITGRGDMLKKRGYEMQNTDYESAVVREDMEPYGCCQLCKEKDKVIAAQQSQIDTQAEYIALLKEQSPHIDGQKRKLP